jgi:hypothetical protein
MAMTVAAQGSSIAAGTYDLSDVTVSGFHLAGTVTLNASGIVSAADITLQDAALGDPVFTQIGSAGGPAGYAPVTDYAYISDPGVGQVALDYLTGLDGAGSVDLCILSAGDCNAYQASYLEIYEASSFGYNPVDLDSGTMETASAESSPTPEAGSLALLGTGILAMASMMRKRKRMN